MATLALTAVGSALGGPLGAGIGSALGAYIDQRFLFPAIFGDQNKSITGPRLRDLQVQSAIDGADMKFCLGPKNRVAGNVIWMSDLIEVKKEEDIGGKGAQGATNTSYRYFVHLAVGVCEGEINAIKRIWANNKLIYNDSGQNLVADNGLTATAKTLGGKVRLLITSPSGGADLSVFTPGVDATVSGWSNGANNGTFRVRGSGTKSDGSTYVTLENTSAVTESAGASILITQTADKFSSRKVTDIRIYKGTSTQDPDSLIEQFEGTGNVPGFRNTAYVILERLALADFGNAVPRLEFEVEAQDGITVGDAINTLCLRHGLSSSQVDTTGLLYDECLLGYTMSGPIEGVKAIEPLLLAFNIGANEPETVLTFFSREDAPTITVDADDLASYEDSQGNRKTRRKDIQEFDLPEAVEVSFLDGDFDMQEATRGYRRRDTTVKSVMTLSLPLTLTREQAKTVALQTLWNRWSERQEVSLTLPYRYLTVVSGDVLSAEGKEIVLTQSDLGQNMLIEATGVVRSSETFEVDAIVDTPPLPPAPDVDLPGVAVAFLIDTHASTSEHLQTLGFYAGVAMEGGEFEGVTLYSSNDDSTYSVEHVFDTEATIGYIDGTLADGPVNQWDRENTLTVVLYSGTLESKSAEEVLNGANHMFVGEELIAFQTATLTDTNTYELSVLLRGRRDTLEFMATHSANELVCLADFSSGGFIPFDLSSIGTTRYFKAVPPGGSIDDAETQTLVLDGNSLRPFAPAHIEGTRDGGNDLTVTWTRVSRGLVRLFTTSDLPLLETSESYEIDVIDGGSPTTNSPYTVSTNSWTYTAAMQTADGLTPGDPVTVHVYQVSDVVGRGFEAEMTI